MTSLLQRAEAQLESDNPQSARRACWLARAALEETIAGLLAAKDITPAHVSERARLSCLEGAYADDRTIAFRAEYAWSRLSEACHQHAYELSPTYAEAKHLVALVRELGTAPG